MFRWGWGCDRAGEAELAVLCCAVLYYRSEEMDIGELEACWISVLRC
jgi:hypothetical protein